MKSKYKFLLYLLIWGLSQTIIAQNIKVEYQVKAKQSLNSSAFEEPFLLFIDTNHYKSLFISKNKLIHSKIFSKYYNKLKAKDPYNISMSASDPAVVEANKYKNKYKVIVEKSFSTHHFKLQQDAFMSKLQYDADLPKLNWKITGKQKQLLGYTVNQAKSHYKGRDYTAWYAPAIAVSDGPLKFWGLPGLILEIYDSKDDYHFIATGIEFPETIELPKKYFAKNSTFFSVIQTTEQNFQKDFDKTFSPDNVLGTAAYIGKNTEEMKAARVQKIKSKYNNPIELTDD